MLLLLETMNFLIPALVRSERTPMLFHRNNYACWINKYTIACVCFKMKEASNYI